MLAEELDRLGRAAIEKACEAGRLLNQEKENQPHGQWLPWLAANFKFTDRTARRWMKLADDIDVGRIKLDTVSNLTEAYHLAENQSRPDSRTFEMPAAGQRLILVSDSGIACFEPFDEDYIHVAYILPYGCVGGSRRPVRRNFAWHFLIVASGIDWGHSEPTYGPWMAGGPSTLSGDGTFESILESVDELLKEVRNEPPAA